MKGLSDRNLVYMQTFASTYPDIEITQALPAQIPWYHNQAILDKLKDYDQRLWVQMHPTLLLALYSTFLTMNSSASLFLELLNAAFLAGEYLSSA